MSNYRPLQPPTSAVTAPEAYEVLRAAVTQDGRFHFASEPPALSPEAWGSLLGHAVVRLAELYARDPSTTDAATTKQAAAKIMAALAETSQIANGAIIGGD